MEREEPVEQIISAAKFCMSNKKKIIFLSLFLSLFLFEPTFAYKTIDSSNTFLNNTVEPTGLSTDNIQTSTGKFIQAALLLVGTVFLALMIYGGFTWMTARGEEDKITKAKETIIAASIGIGIILAAYAATAFITSNLITKTNNSPGELCTDTLTACLNNCNGGANEAACKQVCDDNFSQCIQNP